MIGYLSGKLYRVNQNSLIIDVGGVGYEVFCPQNTLLMMKDIGSEVSFEVYTHVNENAFQLFGFNSIQEKEIFQKIISVSGIGPKLGLSIISDLPLPELINAVIDEDVHRLTRVSGVGKKTAERVVVELKDKFKKDMRYKTVRAANDNPKSDSKISDVTSALINLGYPSFEAKKVVNGISFEEGDTVQSLIKKSLMVLKK